MRRDAAHDLEQAGSAGVDDAGLPEHVELIGRPRERLLPVRDEIREGVLGEPWVTASASARSASARPTVSIVPSCGSGTAA